MDNLDYGIIGNCRSAALISKTGSIDWCCLPEFDSPSVFAKLLDEEIGGSFEINVDDSYTITQKYQQYTNILITSFKSGEDHFEIHDFMPRHRKEGNTYHSPPELIRYFKHISGKPSLSVLYDPKLEYAMGTTETFIKKDFIASLTHDVKFDTVFLYTSFDKESVVNRSTLELTQDEYMLMGYNEKLLLPTTERAYLDLQNTKVYWLNWSNLTPTYKKFNEEISRSALTLKLLSYDKTGAVLAAATTSLPETIGEVRNWDYRFCWIRDASMVIKVVSELGHKNVARRYLQFIIDLIPDKAEKLQIMYGINKEKKLTEETLEHLSGYKGSKPVRIGNAAYHQKQNDIYGILMDVIYEQMVKFSVDIDNGEDLWAITKGIVWIVSNNWKDADKGIWEFRTEDRHFTFSKVLCWTALDRAIKVAEMLGKQHKIDKWGPIREEIWKDIYDNAWNEEVGAYTQSYGSKELDASVLLMESYGCVDAKDERYIKTVNAIGTELSNDGLLYRYKNEDDFGLPSSSFTVCTFWYINSLFKIGERKKALEYFERLLSYSNHLGLFSEDIDFKTKRLLGNFPQAYSHLALIECAINFSKKESEDEMMESLRE
ncbi:MULTISPECIES: glycoside hydrolase family 15 protein [Maribacter]|uniref:Glucoamylase (Glucan-1,4-alpha-glucosidase), GH15 family n=1 Tax=Maribacter stanieri TaxID=440514 RepID=A0A1I6J943_9FLAO|nr:MULTISPECIES: glycoside hydrolase family 15 protein [Maribacter]SFR75484.1 Glucoamylase (glucan-1,4-alpha-glucosidase), GH15 family [Maribacter stanieri]|tara:strand:+ start:1412 stop:3214 length:1803 start_codon:yes stop_codon:yes gene_type:complete